MLCVMQVDFTAPGDHVLSTIPEDLGGVTFLEVLNSLIFDETEIGFGNNNNTQEIKITRQAAPIFEASLMEWSPLPSDQGEYGILIDCGLGKEECSGEGGHICIMERYVCV